MAAPKKLKHTAPRFDSLTVSDLLGHLIVSDNEGVLWRLDPENGTMRRVVIERPKKASRKKR